MFTLLRNYKAMFMMCIVNCLESSVAQFDTDNDWNIEDSGEITALLEAEEAREIAALAEVDTLDAALSYARTSLQTDVNRDSSSIEQKTVQYLATKILHLRGEAVQDGSIDGKIGNWSIADIEAAANVTLTNRVVDMATINDLIISAESLASSKRAEFAQQALERQSNLLIIAEFDPAADKENEDKVRELQAALKALGADLGNYGPNGDGIDGDWLDGGKTDRAYRALLGAAQQAELSAAESRLATAEDAVESIQGPEDAVPTIAERNAAEEHLEALQQDIADQADVYSRLEMSDEPTAQELKDLLRQDPEGKMLLCQLQADMKLLKDQDGNILYTGAIDGHRGIDYAFGPGTARAVTKALEIYGSITAIRRAARIAEVAVESERNTGTGRTNQGIDLVAQTDGYEAGALEAFLAEYKVTANMPQEIQDGSEEQQEAWVVMQAIAMGDRENANKTRLTFIDGLSIAWNDRIIEVMWDLRANFETTQGKNELMQAMAAWKDISAEDFVNGEVGAKDYEAFELGGRIIDTKLLDSAYIATWSELTKDIDGSSQRWTMEVPIWNPDGSINEKFAELDFANATYINGAIVMTMKNGCEGNLVIIPVQREKYVPPVIVPRTPTPWNPNPRTPTTPDVPEEDIPETEGPGRSCRYLDKCQWGKVWKRLYCWDAGTWGRNPTFGPWEETNENCGGWWSDDKDGRETTTGGSVWVDVSTDWVVDGDSWSETVSEWGF